VRGWAVNTDTNLSFGSPSLLRKKKPKIEFEGLVERCFSSCWAGLMFKLRVPLTVALLAVSVAAGFIVFSELTLASKEIQLLTSSHMFSRYLEQVMIAF
jgi:hypothetical protein